MPKNVKKQNDNNKKKALKRFNKLIKKNTEREIKFIGCSTQFLRHYIETKFVDNMEWKNFNNVWEIDFVKPIETFNFLKKGEQAKCFNWRNLRPCLKNEVYKKTPFENVLEELKKKIK